ncbi:integrase family protein [Geomonas paludis]|uniref:Integrase n=1 Tax=Geomonas paludis TaxID=2740185 RepID=A0A6V8MRJ1_9BACT|nr:integrase family protein [Geomonas paludis]UPU36263.1 integrase family protein [Geomonas paludis]GFO62119.1 integrase [Geomonas paludis]
MAKLRKNNKGEDLDFTRITELDPELEEWRAFAAEWIKNQKGAQGAKMVALDKFIESYIHDLGLKKYPAKFLASDYEPPVSFYDHLQIRNKAKPNNYIVNFLDWVLETHFSAEDDNGRKVIAPGFDNPFSRKKHKGSNTESNKAALPSGYIRELREILCPPTAQSLSDWKWAIENAFDGPCAGDWFEVDPSLIDPDDPDCIWRERTVPIYEYMVNPDKPKSVKVVDKREIVEMWSPVRWVALYIKLELPLRTAQVRWLDSGEADTYRYEGVEIDAFGHPHSKWVENRSPLACGSVKHPYQKGVFRRSPDPETGMAMTALYINTNKTADIDKVEDAKGYVVPWEHPRALPWLLRLRDWQAKYNPIEKPVPWTSLELRHIRVIKHTEILAEMGDCCFLFRAVHSRVNDAQKNLIDQDKPIQEEELKEGWRRLLEELENRVKARDDGKGQQIIFVTPGSRIGTKFPLHSLRVSLITAYAIDGGVPLGVLAKCIAGHARIIMTLYYTKAGVRKVTEVMEEAERKLLEGEKNQFESFLAEATYKQIEMAAAFNDPIAIQAIMDNRSRAGWVADEKGICPLGCSACDKGHKMLRQGKEKEEIVPVPGFPKKNCVRCRFFLTGPAFLPGLLDHANWLLSQLNDRSERYVRFEQIVEELQDEMMACTEAEKPFMKREDYERYSRHYEQEAEKCNMLGDDLNATVRLMRRCMAILKDSKDDDGKLSLVPVGGMGDIEFAFEEVSETHQLAVLCESANFYPEADSSKANLRRSQLLDAMLEMNGRAPVFFKLPPDLQQQVGNEFMRLLKVQQGSLRGACDVIEGLQTLEEIGLLEAASDLIEHSTGQPLLLNSTILLEQLPTGTGGD